MLSEAIWTLEAASLDIPLPLVGTAAWTAWTSKFERGSSDGVRGQFDRGPAQTMETLPDKYFDRARQCVLGILLEPRVESAPPYIYTAFTVAISGRTFLITAAHCLEEIRKGLQRFPDAGLILVDVGASQPRRSPISVRDWSPTLLPEVLVIANDSRSNPLSSRELELLDIGFWEIPQPYSSYLQNFGHRPLCESEFSFDPHELGQWIKGQESTYLVAFGFPHLGMEANLERGEVLFRIDGFPLHPNVNPDDGTVLDFEGQFTWVPTSWTAQEWDKSVVGISGGPVLSFSGDLTFLVGLAARERSNGGKPTSLGLVHIQPFLVDMSSRLSRDATETD